jgi:hypothetical protein
MGRGGWIIGRLREVSLRGEGRNVQLG